MPGLKIGFLHARREKSTLYGRLENRLSVLGNENQLDPEFCKGRASPHHTEDKKPEPTTAVPCSHFL